MRVRRARRVAVPPGARYDRPIGAAMDLSTAMTRCAGGDVAICEQLMVAGQLSASAAALPPNDPPPEVATFDAWMALGDACRAGDADRCARREALAPVRKAVQEAGGEGTYYDAGESLARWAAGRSCAAGTTAACVWLGDWPEPCAAAEWDSCRSVLAKAGIPDVPFAVTAGVSWESDAMVGVSARGTPWRIVDDALLVGGGGRRVLGPGAEARIEVASVEDDALRLLLTTPTGTSVREWSGGAWTSAPLDDDLEYVPPVFTPDGLLLYVRADRAEFPGHPELVLRERDGRARDLLADVAGFSVAGDRVLAWSDASEDWSYGVPPHPSQVTRLRLDGTGAEACTIDGAVAGSIAADGTAWLAAGGLLWRWDAGAPAPARVLVEGRRNSIDDVAGGGAVVAVRARPGRQVQVRWAGDDGGDLLDADGHRVDTGWLDDRGPTAGWDGSVLQYWGPLPAPPAWFDDLDAVTPSGPPLFRLVDRTGGPIFPARVSVHRPAGGAPGSALYAVADPDGGVDATGWEAVREGDVLDVHIAIAGSADRDVEVTVPSDRERRKGWTIVLDPSHDVRVPAGGGTLFVLTASTTWWYPVAAGDAIVRDVADLPGGTMIWLAPAGSAKATTWDVRRGTLVPAWSAVPTTVLEVVDQDGRPRDHVRVSVGGTASLGRSLGGYVTETDAAGHVAVPAGDLGGLHLGVDVDKVPVTAGKPRIELPLPDLDLAAPTGEALAARFAGTWAAPGDAADPLRAPPVWTFGSTITRDGEPMRVVGRFGAEWWVTADTDGPRDVWRIRPGGPDGLWVGFGAPHERVWSLMTRR